jgi:hypothetical protein
MSQATKPDKSDQTQSQADEHLSKLHSMSTTAGLTNRDYVAVNLVSIFALLFGLASALAFFSWTLLAIPIAGVVLAIVAIRQVNNSSGTQTGKGIAILGLVLCLLLGGTEAFIELRGWWIERSDETQVSNTLAQAGKLIHDGKYDEAYALFDSDFHSYVRPDEFAGLWTSMQKQLGPLETLEGNGLVAFDSERGIPRAVTKGKIKFAKTQDERFDIALHLVKGKWLISEFALFPKKDEKNSFDLNAPSNKQLVP